jgi:hypothetical protein
MNVAAVEPVAPARDEQVGGDRVTEELCAPLEVVGQDRAGGRMDRHEPPLAELGTAYRQDRLFKIHVGELEVQRFRQAHARHAEQAEQAVEDPVRISANVTDDFGERDRFERSVLSCVEWIVGSGCLKVVERLRG